jgi:hypothetical protein
MSKARKLKRIITRSDGETVKNTWPLKRCRNYLNGRALAAVANPNLHSCQPTSCPHRHVLSHPYRRVFSPIPIRLESCLATFRAVESLFLLSMCACFSRDGGYPLVVIVMVILRAPASIRFQRHVPVCTSDLANWNLILGYKFPTHLFCVIGHIPLLLQF